MKACNELQRKFRRKSGAAYRALLGKHLHLALKFNELTTSLNKSLSEATVSNNSKIEELYSVNKQLEQLSTENKPLKNYVEKLGQHLSFENNGKTLAEVSVRHPRRKLSELKPTQRKHYGFQECLA